MIRRQSSKVTKLAQRKWLHTKFILTCSQTFILVCYAACRSDLLRSVNLKIYTVPVNQIHVPHPSTLANLRFLHGVLICT